jgi:hypothetical protein
MRGLDSFHVDDVAGGWARADAAYHGAPPAFTPVSVASLRGKSTDVGKVTRLALLSPIQVRNAQDLIDSGLLTPEAAGALQNGITGELLTPEERDRSRDEIANNPNLAPEDRARISEVLQNDADEKRRQAGIDVINALIGQLLGGGGGAAAPATPPVEIPAPQAVPAPGVIPPPAELPNREAVPPPVNEVPTPPEVGLLILDIVEGSGAAKAGLRADDVLYSVKGKRVQAFEDLPAILKDVTGPVEVVFWNGETKQYESLKVTPQKGVLGALLQVEPVLLPKPAG